MVEQLFGSKTRVKLLKLFYSNPNRAFYVREITRKIDEQINSVRRELANLLNIGIITSETTNNNRLYYEVNQTFKHYNSLQEIFGTDMVDTEEPETVQEQPVVAQISKATLETPETPVTETKPEPEEVKPQPENPIIKVISPIGKLDLVMLTGQFTRDDRAGVDLLLVGDINQSRAAKAVSELEEQERKSINYAVLTTNEYIYRMQINDRFIGDVLAAKKQVIINEQDLRVNI